MKYKKVKKKKKWKHQCIYIGLTKEIVQVFCKMVWKPEWTLWPTQYCDMTVWILPPQNVFWARMGSSHRRPEHCTWHIHSKCSGINESSRAETATMPLSYDGLKDGMEGGLRPLCLEGRVRSAERVEVDLGGQERKSARGIWPRERQGPRWHEYGREWPGSHSGGGYFSVNTL